MDNDSKVEYKAKLFGFQADLAALETKLATLDIEREEVKNQIAHTRGIVSNLQALCGLPTIDDLGTLGFTDAIRAVLYKLYPNWTSATDIREELTKRGYDLAPYTNPLSSIYTILKRLEPLEVEKREEGLKTVYRGKRKQKKFGWVPRRRRLNRLASSSLLPPRLSGVGGIVPQAASATLTTGREGILGEGVKDTTK